MEEKKNNDLNKNSANTCIHPYEMRIFIRCIKIIIEGKKNTKIMEK